MEDASEILADRGLLSEPYGFVIDVSASEIDGDFLDADNRRLELNAKPSEFRSAVGTLLQERLGGRETTGKSARFRLRFSETEEWWYYIYTPVIGLVALLAGAPICQRTASVTLELEVDGQRFIGVGSFDAMSGMYNSNNQPLGTALADAIEQLQVKLWERDTATNERSALSGDGDAR